MFSYVRTAECVSVCERARTCVYVCMSGLLALRTDALTTVPDV